ncbi:hypothetical protein [Actinocorallia sp. A-T 12471]|uniref:hypothetical protein n=1 Tax=Actinocorallia sp. A-T 12471 TaxID=3089813 RepID=UPI0029CC58A6|nr:hypothetical protein [Actinocorallia sp. A-T 12471]MDX6738578.1 hypothetical protein [Actinocorallia sp. A-T 12471]
MAYLIEPDADFYDSWLAAQREHEEVDGRAEADGLSVEDLEVGGSESVARSLLSKRVVPGIDPGLVGEWWWVEKTSREPDCSERVEGYEYIGRVTLQPEPRPEDRRLETSGRAGRLHVAIRPSRRREGHEAAVLSAALWLAGGRGFPVVLLTCSEEEAAAFGLVQREDVSVAERASGNRYTVPTTVGAR